MLGAQLAEAVTDIRDHAIQTTLPDAACSGSMGSITPRIRDSRLRSLARMLRRTPKSGGRYHDPLFVRPDLVEDDYYRFRGQPHG